jgi:hypothetical protein
MRSLKMEKARAAKIRAGRPYAKNDWFFHEGKGTSIRIFGFELLYIYRGYKIWWIRWRGNGVGLMWKNILYHPLWFSERQRPTNVFIVGCWMFKKLKKGKL